MNIKTYILPAAALALFAGCVTQDAATGGGGDSAPLAAESLRFAALRSFSNPTNIPPYLSGIAWCGGSDYCAVADRAGRMHRVVIQVADDGRVRKPRFAGSVALEGAADLESAAFDPLRKTIWVADESGPRISEHDIATGKRLSDVEIPPHLKLCRPNLSTESLAISPDGLVLWTANEETLACDGPVADGRAGAKVRLFRFVRSGADAPWKSDGEWAYVTDPMAGGPYKGYHRSGVADLAVDENGTLYALEIEFSKKFIPGFRTRIYAIGFDGADDVSAVASLKDGGFRPAGKTLVYESRQIFEMYEGLAFGPPLPGGGRLAVLVSDGDDVLAKSFRYLKAP